MDWLNYLILAIYAVTMVGIAFYCRHKASSTKEFLLAGEGLGGWMTAFAYGTTYFSSVIFIGYAGKFGLQFGLASIWIGVFNAIIGSYLAWKVLARRTKNLTRFLDCKTMPEMFEKRYESKHLKMFASIIMFVFLIPYSASVYQGLGELFESVFKIDFNWCIIIMAVLTGAYLIFGGYFATAVSDFIQGIIMIIGILIMIFCVFGSEIVNWSQGFSQLVDKELSLVTTGKPALDLIVLILLTSFGVWGLPQTVHKFYAVKSHSAIRKATVVSTVFCLVIGVGAYATGAVASLFGEADPNKVMPNILTSCLPAGVIGLIVILVLSASMSTLSSLSLSGSSAVAIDLYKGYIKKDATDKQVNLLLKILCLFFVLMSVLIAIFKPSGIVSLMGLSWGTLAGCFIGPYVYGIYWKKTSKAGVYASLISGLTLTIILIFVFGAVGGGTSFSTLFKLGVDKSPHIGVIVMMTSMIVTPVFSLLIKNTPKNTDMDNLFKVIKSKDDSVIENVEETFNTVDNHEENNEQVHNAEIISTKETTAGNDETITQN